MKQSVAACALILVVACEADKPTPSYSTPDPSASSDEEDAARPRPPIERDSATVEDAAVADSGEAPEGPDCEAIIDCVATCDTDECIDDCADGGTDEAIDRAASVLVCTLTYECADSDCLATYCAEEVLACAGIVAELPDGGVALPDAGPSPDSAVSSDGAVSSGCEPPSGAGTEHSGFIQADEVWTAEDSPHIITSTVSIRGARVTIEPCAVVKLDDGMGIIVGEYSGASASLVAVGEKQGDVTRPITFSSNVSDENWGGIIAVATGSIELEYATLTGGGHPDGHGIGHATTLASLGDDNRLVPLKNVSVKHVAIRDSASLGFVLAGSGAFTDDSTDLTVTGSGEQGRQSGNIQTTYAGYAEAPSIHTVPSGSYTGNNVDAVEAYAPFTLEADETFHELDVPYQVVGSFYMRPGTANGTTTLTIDPGVTLRFGGEHFAEGSLILGDANLAEDHRSVQLLAAGTQAAPIVLTSGTDAPAAGDWKGILWGSAPSAGNIMSYVTVEYGGMNSGSNGFGCGPGENDALLFLGWEPTEAFIQNSTFRASLEGGIVSGWKSDTPSVDLATTNTFEAITNGCSVSVNSFADGSCPDNGGGPSCY